MMNNLIIRSSTIFLQIVKLGNSLGKRNTIIQFSCLKKVIYIKPLCNKLAYKLIFFNKVFPRNCNFDEKNAAINPEILCKNKLEEFRDKNL